MQRKACALLAVLALPLVGAGDTALDRATLHGVVAVNVVADPVDPEIAKQGATADGLRTRLEHQLRDAGIRIDPAANEFVALRLRSVRAARGPFAIAITVGFYQPVTLVRDRNVKTATETWEVDTVVLAEPKQVLLACTDSVDELAGRFAAAYKSVNPPGAPETSQP